MNLNKQENDKLYYCWLHNISGVGRKTIDRILKVTDPKALYMNGTGKLKGVVTEACINNIEKNRNRWNLMKGWEILEKNNIFLTHINDKDYPKKLLKIPDPPVVLYGIGKWECLNKPSVAVIGARNCTSYGRYVAKELAKELARHKITVVSGMARGIDGICQLEVLEQKGESIAVLGSGVKVCYPRENEILYKRLINEGLVISESTPFTGAKAGLFPARNRIISGLSDIIVVVEAGEKSGTLITVDMALEQGKEVYCIPGRVTDRLSRGCNQLIKMGAGMVISMEDFLEEICPRLSLTYESVSESALEKLSSEKLSSKESEFLTCLDIIPRSLEEIWNQAEQKKIVSDLSECMEILIQLQINGQVIQEGNDYRLTGRNLVL